MLDDADGVLLKASSGRLYGWSIQTIAATPVYVKFYDKVTAGLSTDTPFLRVLVPGSATGGGNNMSIPHGIPFEAGLSYRITTGIADDDATTITADENLINIFFR